MRKTTLEGWGITREEPPKPFLTYCIYEGENPDFAFYFSQIEEWGILKFCTKIQIYRNKQAPEKIYDSKSNWFLFDPFNENDSEETNFVFDWTLENLVCFRQLINKGDRKYYYPFIIINLSNLEYTSVEGTSFQTLRKDNSSSITGVKTEIDKNTNEEKKIFENIKLEELEWISL
jgi:hypothetical protein